MTKMKGQQLTRFSVRSLSVLCFQERCGEKGSRDGSVGGGPAENEGAHGQGRGGGGSDDQVPGGDALLSRVMELHEIARGGIIGN